MSNLDKVLFVERAASEALAASKAASAAASEALAEAQTALSTAAESERTLGAEEAAEKAIAKASEAEEAAKKALAKASEAKEAAEKALAKASEAEEMVNKVSASSILEYQLYELIRQAEERGIKTQALDVLAKLVKDDIETERKNIKIQENLMKFRKEHNFPVSRRIFEQVLERKSDYESVKENFEELKTFARDYNLKLEENISLEELQKKVEKYLQDLLYELEDITGAALR